MAINFNGRVAIVTGAGGGLGRQHALALAARGAKVLVNDLGSGVHGEGGSVSPAQAVVDEIRAAGGEALANGASVTDFAAVEAMVQQAIDAWGRVDILVNNAGILRDKSFAKMDMADFRLVVDVHLMGAANCCKAVWPHMVAQDYGRIVMTTSSTGLYGNFGQANYGAAKLAQVGLMQTLGIEGAKHHIHVNALAPTAATRMTEGLMPQEVLDALKPEAVVPAMLVLAHESAPTRTILCAGAGTFEAAHITLTQGIHLGLGADVPEQLAGARVVAAIDPVEFKREKAMEFGATHTHASIDDALAALPDTTWNRGFDKVIMTCGVGNGDVLGQAFWLGGKRSKIVVTNIHSTTEASIAIPAVFLTVFEKQLIGSLFGSANPRKDIPKLLELYTQGLLDLDGLVTKTYPIEGINEGYADMNSGKNIRGVLVYEH